MLQLHHLRPHPKSVKKPKRVGRGPGSGHGTYSTRGIKGQKSRSGGAKQIGFEGGQMPLYKRLPKIAHPRVVNKKEYAIINLDILNNRFEENTVITPKMLQEEKIISDLKDGLKILGRGKLTKPLIIKADKFSKRAEQKIKNSGGIAERISS